MVLSAAAERLSLVASPGQPGLQSVTGEIEFPFKGPMFKLKRVYEPAEPQDGYRVLVDRIWPRGISKENARIDLWMKEIGPSNALRKWFGHTPSRWPEFQKRYRGELRAKTELLGQLREFETKHGTVALIYSARDNDRNQAVVLCSVLRKPVRARKS